MHAGRGVARIGAGIVAVAALALPAAGAKAAAPPIPPVPPAQAAPVASARIAGFRSARFGMSESAVRAAIAADFRLSGTAVQAGENPVQRTGLLRIRVAGLIPGGGTAQVDYIFGYRSHTLMEVNILWSAGTDPGLAPAQLVANGAALQAYFQREGFAADRTVRNAVLPDGNVLLFRTQDAEGHAVVLILAGKRAKGANDQSSRLTPTALTLAYAADPAHPDVFELKNGAF
ncbi:MAG TPA: hypothetical protein VMF62_18065 [Acetobacteraceae bacterium]|nr:hypothetical protein [Acetobacteraceae bacterium]